MNAPLQSKISAFVTLKNRKAHLTELINLTKPRTGKATQIETLTISAIDAEIKIIEQQLKKRG